MQPQPKTHSYLWAQAAYPFALLPPQVIKRIAAETNGSVMNFDITDNDVQSLRAVCRSAT